MDKRIAKSLRWRSVADVAGRALDRLVSGGLSEPEALLAFHRHVQRYGRRPSPSELPALQDAAELGGHREVAVLLSILTRWSYPEDEDVRLFLGTWAARTREASVRPALIELAVPVVTALPPSPQRDTLLAELSG